MTVADLTDLEFDFETRTTFEPDSGGPEQTLSWICGHEHVSQDVLGNWGSNDRFCMTCRDVGELNTVVMVTG